MYTSNSRQLAGCVIAGISSEPQSVEPELHLRTAVTTASAHAKARLRRGKSHHTTSAHAQQSLLVLLEPTGWSTIVRQQHPLQSHRLSAVWTGYLPFASVISDWWWCL